jgi:hypothetical protein
MGATRTPERVSSAFGLSPVEPVRFEACKSIQMGGVLFLLPFLLECHLLSYQQYYAQREGYYNFDSLFILQSFLFLLRIKNIEQSKGYNPGELGKLIGYDRIPEVKTFHRLINELTLQKKTSCWGAHLSEEWIEEEEPELYYIDGHVQVYHGYLANLGKKHVSRQRLCLPGMMEFWVNDVSGKPFFFVTAQVNEKMIEMLESEIIPRLLLSHTVSDEQKKLMKENADYPLFTLIFDREAYSPAFFNRLWKKYRIAIVSYRKNVKDTWDKSLFAEVKIEVSMEKDTVMMLAEQDVVIDNVPMREVRKLSADGHQCSILTTNRIWTLGIVAIHMFGRWIQENYFRYMRQDYDMDKILQYSIDEIYGDFMVVNQEYNNITYRIKKVRDKLSHKKVDCYEHAQKMPEQSSEPEQSSVMKKGKEAKLMNNWLKKQLSLTEEITEIEEEIKTLVAARDKIPYKIPVSEMPEKNRYNKLNQEGKFLQNIIKMICYRAETAFANLLSIHFKRFDDEIRTLVKTICRQTVDLYPDYHNNQLIVTLYPLANLRSCKAVENVIQYLNLSKTLYPGTQLMMIFKIATI